MKPLGYAFQNLSLLVQALTHPSYANENDNRHGHYQRLEFLGDALIGFVLADMLFERFPDADEGVLSKLRARLVTSETLALQAATHGLVEHLLLGRGAEAEGSRQSSAIHADLYEAIIAAIYCDSDYATVREILVKQFMPLLDDPLLLVDLEDSKSSLQQWLEQRHKSLPRYTVIAIDGPGHDLRFTVSVHCDDEELGRGTGRSKKNAQHAAARQALQLLTARQAKDGTVPCTKG